MLHVFHVLLLLLHVLHLLLHLLLVPGPVLLMHLWLLHLVVPGPVLLMHLWLLVHLVVPGPVLVVLGPVLMVLLVVLGPVLVVHLVVPGPVLWVVLGPVLVVIALMRLVIRSFAVLLKPLLPLHRGSIHAGRWSSRCRLFSIRHHQRNPGAEHYERHY